MRVALMAGGIVGVLGGVVVLVLLGGLDPVRTMWDLRDEREAAPATSGRQPRHRGGAIRCQTVDERLPIANRNAMIAIHAHPRFTVHQLRAGCVQAGVACTFSPSLDVAPYAGLSSRSTTRLSGTAGSRGWPARRGTALRAAVPSCRGQTTPPEMTKVPRRQFLSPQPDPAYRRARAPSGCFTRPPAHSIAGERQGHTSADPPRGEGGGAPRHLRTDRGHREDDRVDQVDAVGLRARVGARDS